MLKLMVEKPDQMDAVAPVSWCVDRETLQWLEEHEVTDPHILISVVHRGESLAQEVDRILVPLGQLMEYVQFNRAGTMVLNATIVWPTAQNVEAFAKMFARCLDQGGSRKYTNHVYQSWELDRGIVDVDFGILQRLHPSGYLGVLPDGMHDSLQVQVPKEFFAKESPKWLKGWVEWVHRYPSVDQCQFRRRALFAFTLQPILILGFILGKEFAMIVAMATGALVGSRGIRLGALLHPIENDVSDAWLRNMPDKGWNFFVTDKEGKFRGPVEVLFIPWIWALVLLIFWMFSPLPEGIPTFSERVMWSTTWALAWTGEVFLVVTLSVASVVFVAHSVAMLGRVVWRGVMFLHHNKVSLPGVSQLSIWLKKHGERLAEEARTRRALESTPEYKAKELALYYSQFQTVSCDEGVTGTFRVAELPKERRTVNLRFKEFKAKVCRPFATR